MKTTVNLIQQLMVMEGHSLEAYKDEAGVPTIGYGHTKGVRMGSATDTRKACAWATVSLSNGQWNF